MKSACKKKVLYKRLPICEWLPKWVEEKEETIPCNSIEINSVSLNKTILRKIYWFLLWFFSLYEHRYSSQDAIGDIVAGITVGLTVIPQALAYAGIAGLDPAVSLS